MRELTDRELAQVLAALRHWQNTITPSACLEYPQFDKVAPMDDGEIDELCSRLNTTDEAELWRLLVGE